MAAAGPLPRPLPSYADDGEDIIASRFFLWPCKGVYVDIGCNDPVDANNTYLFYQLGWRGVCIDANPRHAAAFAQHRPEDRFLACGVDDKEGELTFYHIDAGDRVSSFDKSHADTWAKQFNTPYREEKIRVRPINDILTDLGITQVDYLSVDVEMLDEKVITSFDYGRWRPRVIIVEDHMNNPYAPMQTPIFKHLSKVGYMYTGRSGTSSIYIFPITDAEKHVKNFRETYVS